MKKKSLKRDFMCGQDWLRLEWNKSKCGPGPPRFCPLLLPGPHAVPLLGGTHFCLLPRSPSRSPFTSLSQPPWETSCFLPPMWAGELGQAQGSARSLSVSSPGELASWDPRLLPVRITAPSHLPAGAAREVCRLHCDQQVPHHDLQGVLAHFAVGRGEFFLSVGAEHRPSLSFIATLSIGRGHY